MADQAQAAAHWDAAYAQGDDTRSWFAEHRDMSLRVLGAAGVSAADALIDAGGGASPLAGSFPVDQRGSRMSEDRLYQIRRGVLGAELAGRERAGRLTDANLRLPGLTGGPEGHPG